MDNYLVNEIDLSKSSHFCSISSPNKGSNYGFIPYHLVESSLDRRNLENLKMWINICNIDYLIDKSIEKDDVFVFRFLMENYKFFHNYNENFIYKKYDYILNKTLENISRNLILHDILNSEPDDRIFDFVKNSLIKYRYNFPKRIAIFINCVDERIWELLLENISFSKKFDFKILNVTLLNSAYNLLVGQISDYSGKIEYLMKKCIYKVENFNHVLFLLIKYNTYAIERYLYYILLNNLLPHSIIVNIITKLYEDDELLVIKDIVIILRELITLDDFLNLFNEIHKDIMNYIVQSWNN